MRWLMMRLLAAYAARRWRVLVAVLLLFAGQANVARAATGAVCQSAMGAARTPAATAVMGVRLDGAALVVAPAAHPRGDAGQSPASSTIAAICQSGSALISRRTRVPLPPTAAVPVPHANARVPASITFPPQVPPPRLG